MPDDSILGSGAARAHRFASAALGWDLVDPVVLGGSDRSVTLRCTVLRGDAGCSTVVVKHFPPGPDGRDGYTRERVGLGLLAGTPALLATDDEQHLLVMSDLGDCPTLADLLLGPDPGAAHAAAVGWAGALGGLLAEARHRVPDAQAALVVGTTPWNPADAVRAGVARLVDLVGAEESVQVWDDELAPALAHLLRPDPSALVLSPGDTCPDNALLTATGWRFLDAEGTTIHHVALDAAYALLPFPSCWCVFRPPPGLAEAMLDAFTAALAPVMPGVVGAPRWRHDVDLACVAWVLAATGWLTDGAVAGRPTVGPTGRQAPSFRALLTERWRWGAERLTTLPKTSTLLGQAADWAGDHWGAAVADLPPYPAFQMVVRRLST